jgi:hypothetical protein
VTDDIGGRLGWVDWCSWSWEGRLADRSHEGRGRWWEGGRG